MTRAIEGDGLFAKQAFDRTDFIRRDPFISPNHRQTPSNEVFAGSATGVQPV
ncbi:hypothetical protein [Methylobacterium sp. Leaf123]|uniref:hypothetical protein n=1 Tax=Methylobacterium sp. Leaf123 TaxID=1736264 RepID=UPI000A5307BA|nr:hypothetical protein [Methylobacterium sp. Leaf123]